MLVSCVLPHVVVTLWCIRWCMSFFRWCLRLLFHIWHQSEGLARSRTWIKVNHYNVLPLHHKSMVSTRCRVTWHLMCCTVGYCCCIRHDIGAVSLWFLIYIAVIHVGHVGYVGYVGIGMYKPRCDVSVYFVWSNSLACLFSFTHMFCPLCMTFAVDCRWMWQQLCRCWYM